VNFVKNGNPNGNNLPEWKPFNKTQGNIMELGERPVLTPGILKKNLVLWNLLSGKNKSVSKKMIRSSIERLPEF